MTDIVIWEPYFDDPLDYLLPRRKCIGYCGLLKPASRKYFVAKTPQNKRKYLEYMCKACRSRYSSYNVIKTELVKRLRQAHYRAIELMLHDDPDLLQYIYERDPYKFRRYLGLARKDIVETAKRDSQRYGRPKHYTKEELWEQLSKDLKIPA